MTVWLLCGLGLVILVLAGDALVKGAVNLALLSLIHISEPTRPY